MTDPLAVDENGQPGLWPTPPVLRRLGAAGLIESFVLHWAQRSVVFTLSVAEFWLACQVPSHLMTEAKP